ncbi:MAG TPA: hypothetical protein VF084_05670 [Nitrososphaeraceae archaeon]
MNICINTNNHLSHGPPASVSHRPWLGITRSRMTSVDHSNY